MADDVSLTWTRADVDVLAWLLTWTDDVIRMTSDDISSRFPVRGPRDSVTGVWRRSQKLGRHVEARVMSDEGWNFRFCRSVDEEAVMAARVPRT